MCAIPAFRTAYFPDNRLDFSPSFNQAFGDEPLCGAKRSIGDVPFLLRCMNPKPLGRK